MNRFAIVTVIALSVSVASASPFDFQRQIGTSELGPDFWEGPMLNVCMPKPGNVVSLLFARYHEPYIDEQKLDQHVCTVVSAGPTCVPFYEAYRDLSIGTPYRSYHGQFHVDADWAAVAWSSSIATCSWA